MNRVSINHALGAHSPNKLAIALLLLGLGAITTAYIYLLQMSTSIELIKEQLETQSASKKENATQLHRTLSQEKSAELGAVNEAIEGIVLPWPALFKTLEQASQEDIKLLTVEPKMQDKSVSISAITSGVENMRAYIKRLNAQGMLKSVSLISTEAVVADAQTVTQFELKVTW